MKSHLCILTIFLAISHWSATIPIAVALDNAQLKFIGNLIDANIHFIFEDAFQESLRTGASPQIAVLRSEMLEQRDQIGADLPKKIAGLKFESYASKNVPEDFASKLARHLPDIKSLSFDDSDPWLTAISHGLRELEHLEYLSIKNRGYNSVIKGDELQGIHDAIESGKSLKHLYLHDIEFTNELLSKCLALAKLRSFSISFSNQPKSIAERTPLDAGLLSKLICNNKQLREVRLANCPLESNFDFHSISQSAKLTKLELTNNRLTNDQLVGLGNLESLASVVLSQNPVTDAIIDELLALEDLEYIGLDRTAIQDRVIELRDLPNLENVKFSFPALGPGSWSDEELRFIARFSDGMQTLSYSNRTDSLNNLDAVLGGIHELAVESRHSTSYIEVRYEFAGKPKTLRLEREFSSQDWQALSRLKKLNHLSLRPGFAISTRQSRYVTRLPRLTKLVLGEAVVSVDFLRHISNNPKLASLTIETAQVRPHAFKNLAPSKALKEFRIEKGEILGLARNRLDGIQRATQLRTLWLHISGLRDDDLAPLANLKHLESLSCEGQFGPPALSHCSRIESLQTLTILGINLKQPSKDLRALVNPDMKFVRLRQPNDIHYGTIYSQSVANEFGITMAGECSCGCMDVTPVSGQPLPAERFTFANDTIRILPAAPGTEEPVWRELVLEKDFAAETISVDLSRHNPATPIHIHGFACETLNIKGLPQNLGVYGDFQKVVLEPGGSAARSNLFFSATNDLVIHAKPTLQSLTVHGEATSIHFSGSFPRLESVPLVECAPTYFSVPHSGECPAYHFSDSALRIETLRNLRLLKIPYTSTVDADIPDLVSDSASVPPLIEVDLRGCNISDVTVEKLAGLKSLRILKVAGCELVTDGVLKRLKEALPNLRIDRLQK